MKSSILMPLLLVFSAHARPIAAEREFRGKIKSLGDLSAPTLLQTVTANGDERDVSVRLNCEGTQIGSDFHDFKLSYDQTIMLGGTFAYAFNKGLPIVVETYGYINESINCVRSAYIAE